ncbi:MAG: tRNA (adenosine(37)-N6)-threonylcarbamoyltransferase complex transferase subunit TsaD [Rhodothermus sp.]|nr:tRNA (adenosine(37)-N6)-threonylcarbamoyltransferase complex transferase subunit TsaD [Rhodothermus sp.]
MTLPEVILGIETSCDDTAAAVVIRGQLSANVVASQQTTHLRYGGVVPELASRDHQRRIVLVVRQALQEADLHPSELDAIAVTYGPGLVGSLLVGLSFAKAFALGLGRPLIGVNHLEGHIYSVFIEPPSPPFPYLCLIVSGGHTQLMRVDAGFRHTLLGRTRDDAAGEAFDKVARLLGLGYPGGPEVDRLARQGRPDFVTFPRPRLEGYDFSFSGLKTAVRYYLDQFSQAERVRLLEQHRADLCASFQQAVVDVLIDVLRRAILDTGLRHVAIVGGVSANSGLRAAAQTLAEALDVQLYIPPLPYCMDNAAMIAITGYFKAQAGQRSPLTLAAIPALSD